MNWFTTLLPYALSASLCATLLAYAWFRRTVPAAAPLAGYWGAQLLWVIGYIGELLAPGIAGKLAWDSFQFVGYFALVPFVVQIAKSFVSPHTRTPARFWLKWSLIPAIVTSAALTDPWHHQMRASAHVVEASPSGALWYAFTSLDYLGMAYLCFGHAYAVTLLIKHGRRASRLAKRQGKALVLGVLAPMFVITPMVFGYNPFPQRDISPFAFLIGGLILSWGLFQSRFFELLPVARDVVFESISDGVVVVDVNALVIDVNPAALAILGLPVTAILGEPFQELLERHSLDVPMTLCDPSRLTICLVNGRWFEIVRHSLSDASTQLQGGVFVLHDVTDAHQRESELQQSRDVLEERVRERTHSLKDEIEQRKLAEVALAQSERKFRAIFEQAFQLVGITSPEGILLEVNGSALSLVGVTAPDVIGKAFWETPWWTHSDAASSSVRNAIGAARLGQFVRFESTHRAYDGSVRYLDFSLTPVKDDAGEVILLIPEGRDITEFKHSEDERRLLAARLHQAQRLEALGRFAGGIAHDFNNILTVIAGNVAMLEASCARESEDAVAIDDALDATQRAAALTRQLLTFSRGQVIEPRIFDPLDTLRGLEKLLVRVLREDILLSTQLPAATVALFMDPSQFEQIIVNLAVNARDAMSSGGKLTIEVVRTAGGEVPLVPGAETRPEWLRIDVEDTGVGIPESDLPHVFEPFFTTKSPGLSSGSGAGLGLATVQSIVARAGGSIRVVSRLNEGTRFSVYLPCVDVDRLPAIDELIEPSVGRLVGTVMVVEDQPKVRDYIVRALQRAGFRVSPFERATDALAFARSHPEAIDVILTDLVMPILGGAKLVEELQKFLPGLPVVLMSGHIDEATLGHVGQFARAAFLEKPFSPGTLVAKVSSALGGMAVRSTEAARAVSNSPG